MREEGFREASEKLEFLLRTVCAKLRIHGREVLARQHLTPPQFEIMSAVYFEGEIAQSEIPRKLHLARSTVSALLDRLEKQGMISRRKTTRDKRISNVKLTFKGANVMEQVIDHRVELVANLMDHLSREEREEFIRMVGRLAYLVEAHEGNI